MQHAIATPEEQRTPGEALLASQVIRTTSVSSGEIDRIMTPEDLAEKKLLNQQIARVENERPAAASGGHGLTDGDYRFTPDGPGDEPAPGKGISRRQCEGSFLLNGPGKYQPPPSYFLIRGDVNSRGSADEAGIRRRDHEWQSAGRRSRRADGRTSGRRRALAEWLVSPDNPLTARVMVNRIWSHHFGRGIVATLDNFGKMGEMPTHPELLDWLAVEFMDRGWSIKQMHRLIMTSEAYQMSSEFSDRGEQREKDPGGQVPLAVPRSSDWKPRSSAMPILAASGALNLKIGGPPVFPPSAAGSSGVHV